MTLWLQPGDCIILNAANSTVGQFIIQLCHLLHLRCVAVVRQREQALEGFTQCTDRLKALGATHVIEDKGSLKVCSCCRSCRLMVTAGTNIMATMTAMQPCRHAAQPRSSPESEGVSHTLREDASKLTLGPSSPLLQP